MKEIDKVSRNLHSRGETDNKQVDKQIIIKKKYLRLMMVD